MGWSPKQFWKAHLPEVIGAIIGNDNAHIEKLKMAWEPARFMAFVFWNVSVERKFKCKHEQELRRFPWESKIIAPGETRKVIRSVMKFRDVVKNKWGLKYKGELWQ